MSDLATLGAAPRVKRRLDRWVLSAAVAIVALLTLPGAAPGR